MKPVFSLAAVILALSALPALAWERVAAAEDDLSLLNSSVALDDGTPRRLNRGGVVLSW